jgi:glycogen debranching enzyme
VTTPTPFHGGHPVALGADRSVTLLDGSTFCISTDAGDVVPGDAAGLFFRDTRIASRWQLLLDGHPAQALSVLATEARAARFVARRVPDPGHAESTLLVVRDRIVGEGLRETIALDNLGPEPTALQLDLHVDADFADLFAVKEGRAAVDPAEIGHTDTDLVLHSRSDSSRGLVVNASGEPRIIAGVLSWRVVIPPRERWSTEVVARPLLDNKLVEPRFRDRPAAAPLPWRERNTDVKADHPLLDTVLHRTDNDLDALRTTESHNGELAYVAAGAPWFMTLFGRDSLLTAWMALLLDVDLAVGTLRQLASLQGQRSDPRTEEEPGRILHELRHGPASAHALGGNNYYGTVDATPLFVMLLGEAWRWGADQPTVRQLLPAADAALSWIERHGDRDGDGFVEYRRATDRGLANQGWKDSWDAITFATGRLAEPPIALCEVQGYAYAAWLARAQLAEAFDEPAVATRCRSRAEQLKQQFADQFWLPDRGWPALALDRDHRPVDALTSNPGHCLWTGILTEEHAGTLIGTLAGADLDSGYGLRTMSTRMAAYNPMSYHNGSVWPHDTALCVAGLMRYAHLPGAVELAHRLAGGVLDAATAFGGRLPELYCGFASDRFHAPVPYPTACSPQAWASAAPLLLVRALLGLDPDVPARRVRLRPQLPPSWGTIRLRQLRLGKAVVEITAAGQDAGIQNLPGDWTVVR